MAEKKAESRQSSGRDATAESVAELLTSILNQVQRQVQTNTPRALKALEGAALQAVEQFQEIDAALALVPHPTITLQADPLAIPNSGGGKTKLTWSSTNANTVSIDNNIGEVQPAATGSIEVFVGQTTTFTATAKNPCGSATDSKTVNVAVAQ